MTFRPDTYSNRVRAQERRSEAFTASLRPDQAHAQTHTSFTSMEAAQARVDQLTAQGRPGAYTEHCEECGKPRITR